jgi:hypothetical protein
MGIDNGVVQGAVLSVTLFLIAISEMANKVRKPRNDQLGTSRNQTILCRRLDVSQLTWRPHIENVKAKCSNSLKIMKHLEPNGGRTNPP